LLPAFLTPNRRLLRAALSPNLVAVPAAQLKHDYDISP